ncbi:MAG: phenylacetic acid degradation operon negative regulatory protein, partial [Rhodococcus sp. (in: high G+C Gram-positive bacteria)]
MSATRVVLDLATASPDTEFSTAVLTRAGEIVGVSASSIRVAAGRLCRENKLRRTARGTYVLNPDGIPTYSEVEGWRTRTDRIRPWD